MIKLHTEKASTDYKRATWFSFLSSMKIAYVQFLLLNTVAYRIPGLPAPTKTGTQKGWPYPTSVLFLYLGV